MANEQSGANTISIGSEVFLLASVGISHLVSEAADDEDARPAVASWRFDSIEPWQLGYDTTTLQEPRWKPTTLCGREWHQMEAGDGPPLYPGRESVYAPECRACLGILGRVLTSRPPDERIRLIVAMAIDEVQQTGESRVYGVPGDQTDQLRSALRTELRRVKLRGSTHHIGNTVLVVSDDAWQALSPEERQAMHDRVLSTLDGVAEHKSPARPLPGVRWDAWGVV